MYSTVSSHFPTARVQAGLEHFWMTGKTTLIQLESLEAIIKVLDAVQ